MHQFKDVVVQMIGGNNCEQKPGSLEVRSLEVRSLEVFLSCHCQIQLSCDWVGFRVTLVGVSKLNHQPG